MKVRMFIFVVLLTIFLGGCGSLDKNLVNSFDESWKVIEPEYIRYIQNDPNLEKESKEIRIDHAKQMTKTIKDAKKSLED